MIRTNCVSGVSIWLVEMVRSLRVGKRRSKIVRKNNARDFAESGKWKAWVTAAATRQVYLLGSRELRGCKRQQYKSTKLIPTKQFQTSAAVAC